MKGSLAVALVIAVVLAGGAVNVSAASTGNAASGEVTAAPQKPEAATPADNQTDALMQKIDTVCADPSSPACAAALSQIEPCGKSKAPAMADAGHAQSSPSCSAD